MSMGEAAATPPGRTHLWAEQLLADPGAAPISGAAVTVEDGAVVSVEQRPSQPGDVVYQGATLLPGLFDLHIHLGIESHPDDPLHRKEPLPLLALRCARNAAITLRSGVTTCRDAGTRERATAYVRAAAARGLLEAPRVFTAGRPLGAPEGHCNYMTVDVRHAADATSAVLGEVGAGAEWIKLMVTGGIVPPSRGTQLQPESVHAAVAEAHRLGARVMAHSETGAGAQLCLEAGVDTIEHGVEIDDGTLASMAERGITLVPTLMAFWEIVQGHNPALAPTTVELARAAYEQNVALVQRARQAGVRLATGTDGSHGSIALELRLLAQAGLSAAEALRAATENAADALGYPELGRLLPGCRADVLVVEGDPLTDIAAVGQVRAVWLDGRLVHQEPTEAFRA